MAKLIKNVEHSVPFVLADLVEYQKGKVASLTLAQKPGVGVTLFAFDKGEEISTHESGGDAMVIALDGKGEVTIDGQSYILNGGDTIVMPWGSMIVTYHPQSGF